jgi:hypothetical protein
MTAPEGIPSGHTTGVRAGKSDQEGAVPLKNGHCSNLDRRGTEGKFADHEAWKCDERYRRGFKRLSFVSGTRSRNRRSDGRSTI